MKSEKVTELLYLNIFLCSNTFFGILLNIMIYLRAEKDTYMKLEEKNGSTELVLILNIYFFHLSTILIATCNILLVFPSKNFRDSV